MRTSSQKLNPILKKRIVRTFAQVLSDLRNEEEALVFIKDFFTGAEIETFAKRLAISYWLEKSRSYTNIKNNLKVSTATIASVQERMTRKGFKDALKKIEAEEWANKWIEKIKSLQRKRT